jgi:hypothetical protein
MKRHPTHETPPWILLFSAASEAASEKSNGLSDNPAMILQATLGRRWVNSKKLKLEQGKPYAIRHLWDDGGMDDPSVAVWNNEGWRPIHGNFGFFSSREVMVWIY